MKEWVICLKDGNVIKIFFQDRSERKPDFSTYVTYMGRGWVLDKVNWGKYRCWYRAVPRKVAKELPGLPS